MPIVQAQVYIDFQKMTKSYYKYLGLVITIFQNIARMIRNLGSIFPELYM